MTQLGVPNVTEQGGQYINPGGIASGEHVGSPVVTIGRMIVPGPPQDLFDLSDRWPRNDQCVFTNAYDVIYNSKTDGSEDILEFKIPSNDPCRASIVQGQKIYVPSENRYWFVLIVQDSSSEAGVLETQIHCEAPHYELRGIQVYDLNRQHMSASAAIGNILRNSGWTFLTSEAPQLRNFAIDHATVLESLQQVLSAYGGELKYDENAQTVSIFRAWGDATGIVVSWDKNLQAVSRRLDTTGVVDVVICEGNSNGYYGPTIGGACIANDFPSPNGKLRVAYITNSDLLDDGACMAYAQEQGVAINLRVYEYSANAADLSFLAGYETEGLKLGDWVTLLDPELNINVRERIVERHYNVLEPWKSTYQFSNILPIFTSDAPPQNFPTASDTGSSESCRAGTALSARQMVLYSRALAVYGLSFLAASVGLYANQLEGNMSNIQAPLQIITETTSKPIAVCGSPTDTGFITKNSFGLGCGASPSQQSSYTATVMSPGGGGPVSKCTPNLSSSLAGGQIEQDMGPAIISMNLMLGCISSAQAAIFQIINRLVWSFNDGPADTCGGEIARAIKHRLKAAAIAALEYMACLAGAGGKNGTVHEHPATKDHSSDGVPADITGADYITPVDPIALPDASLPNVDGGGTQGSDPATPDSGDASAAGGDQSNLTGNTDTGSDGEPRGTPPTLAGCDQWSPGINVASGLANSLPPCISPTSQVGQLFAQLGNMAAALEQGCNSCCDIVVDGVGSQKGSFAKLSEAFTFIENNVPEGRTVTICMSAGGVNVNDLTSLTWSGSLNIVGVGVGEHAG